jgi:hypothetical protein
LFFLGVVAALKLVGGTLKLVDSNKNIILPFLPAAILKGIELCWNQAESFLSLIQATGSCVQATGSSLKNLKLDPVYWIVCPGD